MLSVSPRLLAIRIVISPAMLTGGKTAAPPPQPVIITMIEIPIIIDYDEDAPPIRADDVLAFHLVRVASSQEIDGEIVITDVGVIYQCDKIGNPTTE